MLQNSQVGAHGAREDIRTDTHVALIRAAPGDSAREALGSGPAGPTLVVSALAGLALVVTAAGWHAPVGLNRTGLALLVVLVACAVNFPLPATPRRRIDASVAIFFACLLLYGPPVAAVVVGASALLGHVLLAVRAARLGGSLAHGVGDAVFTAALMMLATSAAGAVYFAVLPESAPAPLTRIENLWGLPMAAAAMFGVISLGRALQAGRLPFQGSMLVTLGALPGALLEPVILYLVGVLIAVATYHYPWAPIAIAAPIALAYLSLRRIIGGLLLDQAVSAVEALADVVDMRDTYTYQHSHRVSLYATRIATEMGMRREQVEEIRLAARVHDLGKIGVPDRVLLKPGRLIPAERELMERHPEMGYEILSRFPEYVRGRHLVLSHHERPDGQGYPHGLRGREIPLGACVIAIADSLDAMTSNRPYRVARSLEEAMEVFADGAGTQWHAGAVAALQRRFERDREGILVETPLNLPRDMAQLERQEVARQWLDQVADGSRRAGGRSHATIRMPAAR